MRNLWKIVTPPFHFDHLPTQVPTSPYWLQDSESAKKIAHFFWGLAPTEPFVSKKPKKIVGKLKIKISFESQTLKKKCFFLSVHFIMI